MIYKDLDLNSELMRYLEDKQVLSLVMFRFKRLLDELILEIKIEKIKKGKIKLDKH